MTASPTNAYLRDAVMTASPEQLQLMLYDGAVRFAMQGREALEAGDYEQAYEKLSRAQKIVLEMERGLNQDVAPELCQQMSALYMFSYRQLVNACVQRDVRPLDNAIKILSHQRETWVMLMDKLAQAAAQIHTVDAAEATDGADEATSPSASSLSVEG